MRRLFQSLTLVLFTLIAAPAFAQDEAPHPTIDLQGLGEVTAAPDMATLTSGVVTQGDTARAALDANNKAAADLMDLMRGLGIADRDIQTTGFSVQPLYNNNRGNEPMNNGDSSPKIVGYQVSNTISVRIRDLDSVGGVLDKAVSAGSNQINGISFSVEDSAPIEDDARRAAVADARHKAELYAEAAGVKLGRILKITENSYGRPQPETFAMARMSADSSVPVAGGELTFSSNVNIVWEITPE